MRYTGDVRELGIVDLCKRSTAPLIEGVGERLLIVTSAACGGFVYRVEFSHLAVCSKGV